MSPPTAPAESRPKEKPASIPVASLEAVVAHFDGHEVELSFTPTSPRSSAGTN
jgi:hypothetical protein